MFRLRLVYAVLSGKPVRIEGIRENDSHHIGVCEFEASFVRLLDKLTNGTTVDINPSGTVIRFRPGLVVGGKVSHDCNPARSIGWYLEAVLPMLLFSKRPIVLTLNGVTSNDTDVSVDTLQQVALPLMKRFGIEGALDIKILKRGAAPAGLGCVVVNVPTVKSLSAAQLLEVGRFRRVRGISWCLQSSAETSTRIIASCKEVLSRLFDDVYLTSDVRRQLGASPGFGLSVHAETTSHYLISMDVAAPASGGVTPEELGAQCAAALLNEISGGGVVDSQHQWLVLTMMALCPEDVSRVRLGKLTQFSVSVLRHLLDFFGVRFKIRTDAESKTVQLACVGCGLTNYSRKTF